ncbi:MULTISPECIES: hypothetical protein [unclassified Arthrobacter]|uniref:hypothetical protein n=1 Tax=unclassified Arthrobacter TaxID=235627 RepID=UPI001E51035F|nr:MULTISPECIES: hypothetical protein [unclassified Arthrobacter]MCC9145679.1 hypothetical protein [Arthrobacter sp. zg-Y919]MDK1276908.1 hypothetical protein [Arthrobacter sp. zg.Y919]WIB04161.1 hypothetical protein QNO10_05760 [Arthrobacter sp. zg-Y919]
MKQERSHELLAWGAFLTVVATVAMLWVGVPYGGVTSASALLLFAFALSWALTPPRPTAAAAPAAERLPAPAVRAAAPVRTAAAPLHPAASHPVRVRTAPHGRRAAVTPVFHEMPAEPSRWTRTFGPPDTGQIPLQPYRSGIPASYATADAGLPDRRQRSHSSL